MLSTISEEYAGKLDLNLQNLIKCQGLAKLRNPNKSGTAFLTEQENPKLLGSGQVFSENARVVLCNARVKLYQLIKLSSNDLLRHCLQIPRNNSHSHLGPVTYKSVNRNLSQGDSEQFHNCFRRRGVAEFLKYYKTAACLLAFRGPGGQEIRVVFSNSESAGKRHSRRERIRCGSAGGS